MGSLAATVAMAAHSELWQMYLAILRGDGERRRGEERGDTNIPIPGCLIMRRGTILYILYIQIFRPFIDVVAVVTEHLQDIVYSEVDV